MLIDTLIEKLQAIQQEHPQASIWFNFGDDFYLVHDVSVDDEGDVEFS